MNIYDILLAKKIGGGGGSSTIIRPLKVIKNGTYTAQNGEAYSPVTVNVPAPSGIMYIYENGSYDVTNKGTAYVSVEQTETINITANGSYDVRNYGFADIDVKTELSDIHKWKIIFNYSSSNPNVNNITVYTNELETISSGGITETYVSTIQNSIAKNSSLTKDNIPTSTYIRITPLTGYTGYEIGLQMYWATSHTQTQIGRYFSKLQYGGSMYVFIEPSTWQRTEDTVIFDITYDPVQ